MAKLTLKSELIKGTNYKYHLVDVQGNDIGITTGTTTISSSTTDFTATSETAGVVKRPIVVGDQLIISNTTNAANEGVVVSVDSVSANSITYTLVSGSPVDETAGSDINITAFKKTYEFLEASGLSFIDGVSQLPWVSKIVDDWDVQDLDIYDPVNTSIEPRAKSIANILGWEPHNLDTQNALRDGALEIRQSRTGLADKIFANFTSDNLNATTDQMYIWFDGDNQMDAPLAAVTQGYINQLVLLVDRTISNNTITGITQANPAVVTSTGHSLATGDTIRIEGVVGMTEVNDNQYRVTVIDANSYSLDGIDSTGFTAYTSGGSYYIDKRGVWNFRCLEPGKTHLQGQVNAQYAEIYSVASNNGLDPKLADGAGVQLVSDGTVSAGGIYANIDVNVDTDEQYDGDVDGVFETFYGFVEGDSQTNQTVHTKIHYLLRQPTNINSDGTGPQLRGDKQPPITSFLGDQMTVDQYYLLNYNDAERNNLRLVNISGTPLSWPQILTIIIAGDSLSIGGTFSIIHEDTFNLSTVTYFQNEGATNQKDITIAASVPIVMAYSTYNVNGHTAGTPLDVRVTYNRPGFIEPDNVKVTIDGNNQTIRISSIPDPSYVAA